MPDIICTNGNCQEPWDWWFLRDDLIDETALDIDKDEWDGKLTEEIRAAFKAIGWEFGERITHIYRCSACPKGDTRITTRTLLAEAMSDMLGDDIDGFISEMEDAEYLYGDQLDL